MLELSSLCREKVARLHIQENTQIQKGKAAQIQNEKIPKNAGIVFSVCVRMVAGLQDYPNLTRPHKDGHKRNQHT